ncbi:MAG TPA: AAA family ATPase [Bacillales bacterium]|nr:AAA family ATPase [Bacillales bacterium]
MRCQNCKKNPAAIELNMQINHKKQTLHLCETCYAKVKNEMKFPTDISLTSFAGQSPFDDLFNSFMNESADHGKKTGIHTETKQDGGGGLLDELGRNLTQAARAGVIDPVIGREKEVERVIETLNRRNKNNPVLIGEPGVGKTAIAEGLALKICDGDVPAKLRNKQIYLLDVSSLVANTGIRGQFEERMKQLIGELQERDDTIVFVDEVHLLVGAGQAEGGSMDAGNILKPALARGDIQLIGATTLKEYRKIEKDAALERRFQPVIVDEPSIEEAVEILQGLQQRYEDYHEVEYTEEAIRACVTLSDRYIQDRFLPDKAIDLLDEAGSKINLANANEGKSALESKLAEIAKQKEEATAREEYERAAKLRDEERKLEEELRNTTEAVKKEKVTVETIQRIVEGKTGIPVRKLQKDEQAKMRHLAEHLNAMVIGQEPAVEKVAKAIRRSRAGLKRKNRPIGSFLFAGPTGVGKTELSKSLAKELFGDEEAMIRLDMSEYMEKHSVSKLIGSPPGYVGHEEAGQLTEQVRRKPYSILLLDEIEKAHPDVQHMFLQIMEDGRLTDSQGRTVSFKDTVIIMTSNAGSAVKRVTVGFGKDGDQQDSGMLETLSQYFKPEFLNRFDGIIEFKPLEREHLIRIVDLMIDEVRATIEAQGMKLHVTDEAKVKLAELGYDPKYGARPLRRTIEEKVEDGIADVLLEEENVERINVNVRGNEIVVGS